MLTLQVKSTWFCGRSRLVPCCALFLLCSFVTARPGMGQAANSASPAESESKATSFYKQGMAALQKGDLESARVAFEKSPSWRHRAPRHITHLAGSCSRRTKWIPRSSNFRAQSD